MTSKKKVLIFIVTYNAERTIRQVLSRIPRELFRHQQYQTEILIIDDCSKDQTFREGCNYQDSYSDVPLTILRNPVNLGYGGNQKVGYRFALDHGFDFVVLLHGDGQYAPEELPRLLQPLIDEECEAVFGSRMMLEGAALKGGMPLYKFYGNKVLTWLENQIIAGQLSEWHSGYRLYSCKTLQSIPFEHNANGFDFDTDIIIQLHGIKARIKELPIPTFYGDEICHVNGLQYAAKIILSCLQYRCQQFGLFYNRKFDFSSENQHYKPKFSYISSHSLALAAIQKGDRLLLLGSGPVELVRPFIEKGCLVSVVDQYVDQELKNECVAAYAADLDTLDYSKVLATPYDKILALDVIEHLKSPETFLTQLRECSCPEKTTLILTTPNIAFLPIRLMLLLGFFNYGKRGILDMTHTRLFTRQSLRTLLAQQGFRVGNFRGIPAPFPLALGDHWISRLLLQLNKLANAILPGLFSYQLYCEARPSPTVKRLLSQATEHASVEQKKLQKVKESTSTKSLSY